MLAEAVRVENKRGSRVSGASPAGRDEQANRHARRTPFEDAALAYAHLDDVAAGGVGEGEGREEQKLFFENAVGVAYCRGAIRQFAHKMLIGAGAPRL